MSNATDRLRAVVSEAKSSKIDSIQNDSDFNKAAVIKDMSESLEAKMKQQVKKQFESTVYPYENETNNNYNGVNLNKNPWGHVVKGIIRDGSYKSGSDVYKVSDLALAHAIQIANEPTKYTPTDKKETYVKDMKHLNEALFALKSHSGVRKFLRADVAGQGLELTPEETREMIWQDFYILGNVFGLMPPGNIETNVKNNRRIPEMPTDEDWKKIVPGATIGVQTPVTARKTHNYTIHGVAFGWDYDLDTDAIVALSPILRNRIINGYQRLISRFLINADDTITATGNINSDDQTPAIDSYYLPEGESGLIQKWLSTTGQFIDAGGDALTVTDMKNAFAATGKYFNSPNYGIVTDVTTFVSIMHLDNVLTVDKFGPTATVLTGQLGSYLNRPIVVNNDHFLAEADGKMSAVTPANNTLGRITFADFSRWMFALESLLIQTDQEITQRQNIMVASARASMVSFDDRATSKHTAGIFNILV